MVSTKLIAVLGALPLAFAQYGAPADTQPSSTASPAAATTTSSGGKAAQTVTLGQGGQLVFTPDTITAAVGDLIEFQFFPKNHSVVQAAFNNPCNPLSGGIFSGGVPTTDTPSSTTFTITVKDTNPIWLYCGALLPSPHCAAGMVAVINPPKSGPNTLDAFRAAAQKTNTSTTPSSPNGGQLSTGGNSPAPSGTTPPPLESTGGASPLVVGSGAAAGLLAAFAGLFL